jgi:hypothetical protein
VDISLLMPISRSPQVGISLLMPIYQIPASGHQLIDAHFQIPRSVHQPSDAHFPDAQKRTTSSCRPIINVSRYKDWSNFVFLAKGKISAIPLLFKEGSAQPGVVVANKLDNFIVYIQPKPPRPSGTPP